eukprot:7001201-Pyramimonas_sp.AAC.1
MAASAPFLGGEPGGEVRRGGHFRKARKPPAPPLSEKLSEPSPGTQRNLSESARPSEKPRRLPRSPSPSRSPPSRGSTGQ